MLSSRDLSLEQFTFLYPELLEVILSYVEFWPPLLLVCKFWYRLTHRRPLREPLNILIREAASLDFRELWDWAASQVLWHPLDFSPLIISDNWIMFSHLYQGHRVITERWLYQTLKYQNLGMFQFLYPKFRVLDRNKLARRTKKCGGLILPNRRSKTATSIIDPSHYNILGDCVHRGFRTRDFNWKKRLTPTQILFLKGLKRHNLIKSYTNICSVSVPSNYEAEYWKIFTGTPGTLTNPFSPYLYIFSNFSTLLPLYPPSPEDIELTKRLLNSRNLTIRLAAYKRLYYYDQAPESNAFTYAALELYPI